MDLDAFKMICAPAWLLCHRPSHYQDTSPPLDPIVLKHRACCGSGPEVWNVVLTMTQNPPSPPPLPSPALYEGPHPAVLLWSDSQYCAVSHGEEIIPHWSDQALAGTDRAVSEEMYTRC